MFAMLTGLISLLTIMIYCGLKLGSASYEQDNELSGIYALIIKK